MRKAVMLVLLLVASTIPAFVSADDEPVRQRSSMTEFTWTGNATSVQVSGEWDDWEQISDLTEFEGVWSISLDLEPGMYCYKLIVDSTWIFDPTEPYRGYCDDFENSIVRVPDTSQPMFTHTIVDDLLTVLWHAGSGGGAPDSTPLALATGLWDESNWSWSLDLLSLIHI